MSEQITCPACGAPIDASLRFNDYITCPYCGTQSYIGESTKALSADSGSDEHATLAMVYTRFEVGKTGSVKLNGAFHEFSIYGRLQYEYEGGYWSEWYIDINNEGYWLQEDEGVYILYLEKQIEADSSHIQQLAATATMADPKASLPQAPNPAQYPDPAMYEQARLQYEQMYQEYMNKQQNYSESPLRPGAVITIDDKTSYHLLEFGKAKMVAYEGDLPSPPDEGKEIFYFDGVGEGTVYSLEIEDNGKDASFYQGWPLEYEDIILEDEPDPRGEVGSKGF